MTPEEVHAFLLSLPGCKRKGTVERPAWYVDDRLVARLEDATTLTVRATFAAREALVSEHPDVFGVAPRMERHEKVQAVLDRGADDTIRAALRAAHEMQRRR